ncbi:glycosyltransferase [Actinomycetospora flava]|uniref:Glycosyltransferase n=1 Tax=Actinomycetospora flava TaxID=3129232 RepID=A0ABU8M5T8_9PSEU
MTDPDSRDFRVTAVIVTFNRRELLLQTLSAVRQQTRPIDKVILVDNGSTDGTRGAEELEEFLSDRRFSYLRLDRNTGGAGGFKAGIEAALTDQADWIWMMDDDVAPEPDVLELLLGYACQSELVHPRRISADGSDADEEHYLDVLTGSRTRIGNLSFRNGKDVVYSNVACFEGALVSRRIVETIGPPDANYFIVDDDTLFGLKASVHTNVAYTANARMRRLLPPGRPAPWKAYYQVRNRFYLFRDACRYLDITPTTPQVTLFYLAQVIELLRSVRQGFSYLRPSVRGFRDGIVQMRGAD